MIAAAVALAGLTLSSPTNAQESGWNAGVDVSASCLSTTVDYANAGTPEQDLQGCLVGVGLSTDYTFQNGLLLGAVGDVSFGDVNTTVDDGNYIDEWGSIDRFATLRGVVGYRWGNFTPYATGGLAWANLTQGESCPDPAAVPFGFCRPANGYSPFHLETTHWQQGYIYGGGIIYQIAPRWRVWGEYLQATFDDDDYVLGPAANGHNLPTSTAHHEPQLFRLGVRRTLN